MAGCWLVLSLACVVKGGVQYYPYGLYTIEDPFGGLSEFCVDWYREVHQVDDDLLLTSSHQQVLPPSSVKEPSTSAGVLTEAPAEVSSRRLRWKFLGIRLFPKPRL